MNTKHTAVTVQEVRVLSELVHLDDYTSAAVLSRRCRIRRPSMYVLLARLMARKLVKRRAQPTRRYPGAVVYAVTVAGVTARRQFARFTGLTA